MHIPYAIVGGGIIGLTIAHELTKKFPDKEVALFEKEKYLGDHTTGRNSGVLHAGLYYPKNSLKFKLCIEGNELWNTLAKELEAPIKRCGKFVVATDENDLKALEALYQKASENLGDRVRLINEEEREELHKFIHIEEAFFSKNTGILGVPEAVKSLERILHNRGVYLLKENKVVHVEKAKEGMRVETERESVTCDVLINAAGPFAVEIRKKLGLTDIENYLVKGNYLKTTQKFYDKSLLYPVPPTDLKGLGVHSTFDFEGVTRFGPNTEEVEFLNYEVRQQVLEDMLPSIMRTFKKIDESRLSLDYAGVRPKIKKDGELYPDFWIKGEKELGIKGYVELLGIESPGLTSAPAIAKYVVENLL